MIKTAMRFLRLSPAKPDHKYKTVYPRELCLTDLSHVNGLPLDQTMLNSQNQAQWVAVDQSPERPATSAMVTRYFWQSAEPRQLFWSPETLRAAPEVFFFFTSPLVTWSSSGNYLLHFTVERVRGRSGSSPPHSTDRWTVSHISVIMFGVAIARCSGWGDLGRSNEF